MSTTHHHESGHGHGDGHGHGHEHGSGLWARAKHVVVPHAHDAKAAIQTAEESSSDAIRTAWISLAGVMATAVAQTAIVAISGSIALLADAMHSLGHLATTVPLIIAFRLGRRAANKRYSYGYRRAEDLVGLLIGLMIAVSVVVVIWESIDALVNPRELTNLGWVFAAGVVGFLGNEVVAVYRIRTGRRIGSAALIAEGQHARADGLTSIAVVLGAVGVWLGIDRADAVAGFVIGLMILGVLTSSMRTICRRLMDAVDEGTIDQMTQVAAAAPGVVGVDRIRARWSGHRMEADAAIRIGRDLDAVAAHRISEEVEHALLHATPSLDEVVVHVHPVVDDHDEQLLHDLSGHHASIEAREAYRRRLAAGAESR